MRSFRIGRGFIYLQPLTWFRSLFYCNDYNFNNEDNINEFLLPLSDNWN